MVAFFFTPTAPTWQGQVRLPAGLDAAPGGLAGLASGLGHRYGAAAADHPAADLAAADPVPLVRLRRPHRQPHRRRGRRRRRPAREAARPPTRWWASGPVVSRPRSGSRRAPHPINGWTVTWTFTDGQTVTQSWGAIVSGGPAVTARNETWNGVLPAGGSATFGFLGSWNGVNSVPSLSCTAS